MVPPSNEVTIMFADIVGSTRLYETMGDENAEKLVTSTLKQLSEIASKSHGETIKTGGDDVLCRFPQADHAITAAREMHEFLAAKTIPSNDYKVAIRVGAHHGQVIDSEGDIYGDAVNLAARVAALARGGKTLITGYTFDQLTDSSRERCRHFTTTTVKGKEQPIDIFDVVWEKTDELTRAAGNQVSHEIRNILTLRYDDNVIRMSANTITSTSLGRSPDCDLIVPSPHASRHHGQIECNRGKFILHDNSGNGSFVTHNGAELFFHQERVPLLGEGLISLGATAANNPNFLIRYSVDLIENIQDEAGR